MRAGETSGLKHLKILFNLVEVSKRQGLGQVRFHEWARLRLLYVVGINAGGEQIQQTAFRKTLLQSGVLLQKILSVISWHFNVQQNHVRKGTCRAIYGRLQGLKGRWAILENDGGRRTLVLAQQALVNHITYRLVVNKEYDFDGYCHNLVVVG